MVTDYNAMSILDTPEIEEEEIVANPRISVAEASETYGTVSYTHLTLPTKA